MCSRMLEVVEGGLCLPEALEVLEVSEAMSCVLSRRWMLWRVGSVCWTRCGVLEVPEVMRFVQLYML